jgi:hypothetical protein
MHRCVAGRLKEVMGKDFGDNCCSKEFNTGTATDEWKLHIECRFETRNYTVEFLALI